jgi:hypothetical protein
VDQEEISANGRFVMLDLDRKLFAVPVEQQIRISTSHPPSQDSSPTAHAKVLPHRLAAPHRRAQLSAVVRQAGRPVAAAKPVSRRNGRKKKPICFYFDLITGGADHHDAEFERI